MTQIYLDAAQWMNAACYKRCVHVTSGLPECTVARQCHSVDFPPHRSQPVQLRLPSDGVCSIPAHAEYDVHSQWHCGPWQYRWWLRGLCLWRWVSLSLLTTLCGLCEGESLCCCWQLHGPCRLWCDGEFACHADHCFSTFGCCRCRN